MFRDPFHNIYFGKRILLTGHTGFKGSWLAIWLRELGAEVTGFSLDPHTPDDNFVRAKLSEKVRDIRGDINDLPVLCEAFTRSRPEFVFHLAAQPIVRDSYDHPIDTFETNAIGTAKVLEAIRRTPSVKGAVIITTDKVYQNNSSIWGFRECDPLGGYDPYSASKACAEIIIESYRKSFLQTREGKPGIPIASARAGNVIGGGDWQQDRLVPDCVRALEQKKPIKIRNPRAIRPWQHVLDALGGYLLLGEKLLASRDSNSEESYAEAWNFGPLPDACKTVEEVTKKVLEYWKSGTWEAEINEKEVKHEATFLTLDISKALFQLKWHPVMTFDESIKYTIDWYKFASNNPALDLYDFCTKQLTEYGNITHSRNKDWLL